ncbi:flavin reductase family protein [Psychrobacillus lasiicapitis]|uniref:Flavin reductase family protein n=1 Tax=Psychrobacillus lasiicapitis TaxID=1636719 RepID=A0A544TCB6_9BACI|nr:flavin reductase family protein [Psychrobacillus lasiicapitis]TQR15095.1 flavin reductase family protein [Psychrobacillus lasiicapitis]GGA22426.1 flavin reductase [Psychrobacillus lasiicapitis]
MLSLNPKNNSERENYKLLIGSIVPRPIAFVTSVGEDGTINGAPFSYFNIVSSNPPMISIAIQRKNGERKDTARNVSEKHEFVVHIVDEDNVEKINITAASLPTNESEIDKADLTLISSESISTPGIKEAKVRFECILEQIVELGEEGAITTDLLIGKIVHYHIDESIYERGRINNDSLKAVSRLAGSNYAKIGEVFSIERPD